MKKILIVVFCLVTLSCSSWPYEYCPECWHDDWTYVEQTMYEQRIIDEHEGVTWYWGDPAGGGASGGGADAGAGGGK